MNGHRPRPDPSLHIDLALDALLAARATLGVPTEITAPLALREAADLDGEHARHRARLTEVSARLRGLVGERLQGHIDEMVGIALDLAERACVVGFEVGSILRHGEHGAEDVGRADVPDGNNGEIR